MALEGATESKPADTIACNIKATATRAPDAREDC